MKHDELVDRIIDRAYQLGIFSHYCRDARRCDGPGLPDLLLAGYGGILWREIKTGSDGLRPDQRRWAQALRVSGHNWGIWREADWESGRVERELQALAQLPS